MSVEKLVPKLVKKKRLNGSYWWFELEFDERFDFKAGQYVSVKVSEFERRSYSIATAPSGKKIGLMIEILPNGVGGKFFKRLKVGEGVEVMGPLGRFVVEKMEHIQIAQSEQCRPESSTVPMSDFPNPLSRRSEVLGLVFVGTGSGVAPLRAMVEDCLKKIALQQSLQSAYGYEPSSADRCGPPKVRNPLSRRLEIHLVWGMRFEKDLFWVEEFKGLEKKYKNFEFELVLSKASESWRGKNGHVTDVLKEMKGVRNKEFYLCGSNQMVDDCVGVLKNRGVAEKRVYFEKYG